MQVNMGTVDRVIRIVVGIVLLYAGAAGMISGILMYLAILFGLILLVTSVVGYCPLYSVLKTSTAPKTEATKTK